MHEIVVDTETTGLDAQQGHKIVEIGCVELRHLVPTGAEFHRYLNPERDIPESAQAIHGISGRFVKNMPRFAEVAEELLNFFGDVRLVIHNAPFDLSFLNTELKHCGKPTLTNPVCDTLLLAQDRFRGERVSLDALCRRYAIDLSTRERHHGALTDAHLLAKVYLELSGGRQQGIEFAEPQPAQPIVSAALEPSAPDTQSGQALATEQGQEQANQQQASQQQARPPFRVLLASSEEKEAHRALLDRIKQQQT